MPVMRERIVTLIGIRRCSKSSLLSLAVNELLRADVSCERTLFVDFDDERLMEMKTGNLDELLVAYREMHPTQSLKDVYMFFDEIQLVEGWGHFVHRVYKNIARTSSLRVVSPRCCPRRWFLSCLDGQMSTGNIP